jgi:p-cymene monooxygenase electron transfer component
MRSFLKSVLGRSDERKKLQILPKDLTIDIEPGKTLLEAALAKGIPYPHDCTVGTCATCKVRLKQGRVREATPFGYTLTKEELDAGYILSCQAFPRDPLTVVELPSAELELPVPQSYSGVVTAIEPLTHDILKVSVRTDRPLTYVAGQYANLWAPGMGRPRSYSFATAPQRGGKSELAFFIRKVPGGEFTEALFAGELDGKTLEIEGPLGAFYLRDGDAPLICIVGGSGLAPVLSLLEQARNSRIRRRCTLLFGARTQGDLYQTDVIASLAGNWPERFDFVPVLSHEPVDSGWTGARGLVTDLITADMAAGAQGYVCGPPPMVDAAIAALTRCGISIDDIHYDRFTDSRDR